MIFCESLENKNLTKFEKTYLLTEAPGAPRRNVKKVNLNVIDKRRADFTKGAEVNTAEEEPEEPQEDPEDIAIDDGEDIPEDELPEDMGDEDISLDDGDIPDEEIPDDGMEDDGGGDVAIDDGGQPEDTGEEPPPDDGGEENADNNGDIAIDDGGGEAPPEDGGDGTEDNQDDGGNGEGEKDDLQERIHKKNLYKKFMNLHSSIKNYVQKLNAITGTDDETNHQYVLICDKLKRLENFLYDYMVIKFKDAPYVQSVLFYQRSVAVINLTLDLLSDLRKKDDSL